MYTVIIALARQALILNITTTQTKITFVTTAAKNKDLIADLQQKRHVCSTRLCFYTKRDEPMQATYCIR